MDNDKAVEEKVMMLMDKFGLLLDAGTKLLMSLAAKASSHAGLMKVQADSLRK